MLQILTPSGWSDFSGVQKTENREVIHCGDLACTPEHLIKIGDEFIEARDLSDSKVINITDVYDVIDVKLGHEYYTNGMVSHNCHFRGSTNSLLSGNVLEQLVTTNPIRELNDGKLSIYKEPVKAGTEITNDDGEVIEVIETDHSYLTVVDCSEGVGGDYHGIHVIDISTNPYEVVCVYHDNKLSPLMLPELLYNMAKRYNNAWVLIENESTGGQVANDLYYDLEYENVVFTVPEKGQQTPTYDVTGRIGVKMSRAVKRIGCANLKTMLESGRIIINHMETVNELGDFVPRGGSYAAADGAHDDLVMPLVMFGWISNTEFFKDLSSDVRKAMIEQIRDNQREIDIEPFGIIDDGNSVFTGEHYFERDELGFFDDPLDTCDDNRFILDSTFGEF